MTLSPRSIVIVLVLASLPNAQAAAETYTIDPTLSSIGFSLRHFVGKVTGKFTRFAGSVTVDPDDPAMNLAIAVIPAASIDTLNRKRDEHLRSSDFLDAARFPELKFRSRSWRKTGPDTFDVDGELTIKDVTRTVLLKVTRLATPAGEGPPPAAWTATATINKNDFNVKDPPLLDATIGDEVAITLRISARKT